MNEQQITDYMGELFAEAMRRGLTPADAEDAVQETMLAALLHLDRGDRIDNLRAWLYAILTRKYYDILRRRYRLPTVTMDETTDFADAENEELIEASVRYERAERLRREVGYLAESYRVIIAKHYFYGQSLHDIAAELGLPEGTVKSRMDFGRKQMKKGLEMMENYTEHSYMPLRLRVCNSGCCGLNEEPMSLVREDDLLAQNLLQLAYARPISLGDLSRAIGVATAYVEPVVRRLVEGELMRRLGDGKVYTDFIIYQDKDSTRYMREQEQFAATHAEPYFNAALDAIEKLKKTPFYSLRLERFMLIEIAGGALWRAMEPHRAPQIFPDRPNGGKWIAMGMIESGQKMTNHYWGREDYTLSGKRCERLDSYLDARELALYNYESSLYPYPKLAIEGFSTFMEAETNALKLFYLVEKGIDPASVDADPRILRAIPQLEREGFLTMAGGRPKLTIPRLTRAEWNQFQAIAVGAAKEAAVALEVPLVEYTRHHRKKIPAHLKSVPEQKLTLPYEPSTMMFVYEAIRRGVHPRDLGYPCPETVVVFD